MKRTRFLTHAALFAALICMLSPLAIPVGTVPVTLASFALLLTGLLLDWRRAGAAVGLYLLLGIVGLPVFSGGQAGFGVLLGPTGGYLWSYLPMVLLVSRYRGKKMPQALMACGGAMLMCYACGTWQFVHVSGSEIGAALTACVLPFIPFDVLKLLAACALGMKLRARLQAAGLL